MNSISFNARHLNSVTESFNTSKDSIYSMALADDGKAVVLLGNSMVTKYNTITYQELSSAKIVGTARGLAEVILHGKPCIAVIYWWVAII